MKNILKKHFAKIFYVLVFIATFLWYLFLIGCFAMFFNYFFVELFSIKNCCDIAILLDFAYFVICSKKIHNGMLDTYRKTFWAVE